MKYISLDIETTGLDKHKNQILEVGMIKDDTADPLPLSLLSTCRILVIHETMQIDNFCARLHKNLFEEIHQIPKDVTMSISDGCVVDPSIEVPDNHWLVYCKPEALSAVMATWIGSGTQNIAGKNAGTFDIPFLKASPGWRENSYAPRFRRRVIDPAILFSHPTDDRLPDLQECLERAGIEGEVQHTALEDALDVVKLVRKGLEL